MAALMVHVTYRPKKGHEDELLALVKRHWPALHRIGLATAEPATVYRGTDKRSNAVSIIEIFSWKDEQASDTAHHSPEVKAIWDPMMPILESLELAVIEPVRG